MKNRIVAAVESIKARIALIQKHKPGGRDHNQQDHAGDRGSIGGKVKPPQVSRPMNSQEEDWVERHKVEVLPSGKIVLFHGTSSASEIRSSGFFKPGTYFSDDPEFALHQASLYGGRGKKVEVMSVAIRPEDVYLGVHITMRFNKPLPLEEVKRSGTKHYPGGHDHNQQDHAGGRGGKVKPPKVLTPKDRWRKRLSEGDIKGIFKANLDTSNPVFVVDFGGEFYGVMKVRDFENPTVRATIPAGGQMDRELLASDVAKIVGMDDMVPVTVDRKVKFNQLFEGRYVDINRPYAPYSEEESEEVWADDEHQHIMGESLPTFSKDATLQEYVKTATVATAVPQLWKHGRDDDQPHKAAAFDFILGNTDRHDSNWMLTADKGIVLIDNGLIMPETYQHDPDFDDGFDSFSVKWETARITGKGFVKNFRNKGFHTIKIPDSVKAAWRGKWPRLRAAMKKRGMSDESIRLARERYNTYMRSTYYDTLGEYIQSVGGDYENF